MQKALFAIAVAFALSIPAEAGPWTREKGGGYAQIGIVGQRLDGEDAVRAELYGEYGISSKWTLNTQLEALTFPGLSDLNQYAYRVTGRRQIWQKGIWRAAFEGGVVGGEAIGGTLGGCDTVGGEARLSFGGGGRTAKNHDWFAFIDGAVREHGNCRRQRIEAGYGREIAPDWLTVSKIYLEEGSGDARSAKFETAISRRFGKMEVSLGYRQEFGGRFRENGLIISINQRF